MFSLLVGGAKLTHRTGTSDHTVYTHYFIISTISTNGVCSRAVAGSTGRIYSTKKVSYTNWMVDTTNLSLNGSLLGPLESLGDVSGVNTTGAIGPASRAFSSKLGNIASKNPAGTGVV